MRRVQSCCLLPLSLGLILLAAFTPLVWAHAILMQSSPASNAVVKGPDLPIQLRFNVRIDAGRSRLHLLTPDGSTRLLPLAKQSSPDLLQSQATALKPGAYRLHWQVLASDGHISSGIVAFTVN